MAWVAWGSVRAGLTSELEHWAYLIRPPTYIVYSCAPIQYSQLPSVINHPHLTHGQAAKRSKYTMTTIQKVAIFGVSDFHILAISRY